MDGRQTVDVPEERYREIERTIASDDSPVGIDAKRTHVIILHALEEILGRLDRIERRLDRLEGGRDG